MHEIPVGPEIIALVAEGWPWTNKELNSHLSSPADILLYLRLRQLNPSSTMPRCPSGMFHSALSGRRKLSPPLVVFPDAVTSGLFWWEELKVNLSDLLE